MQLQLPTLSDQYIRPAEENTGKESRRLISTAMELNVSLTVFSETLQGSSKS